MTDDELTALAAKAAGALPFQKDGELPGGLFLIDSDEGVAYRRFPDGRFKWFKPLEDDADAFSLVTALQIEPMFGGERAWVRAYDRRYTVEVEVAIESDSVEAIHAATRRAVVQLAAKIAERQQTEGVKQA